MSQMIQTKKEPEEEFTMMSQQELCNVASVLKDENRVLKAKFSELSKENNLLKNSVINNSKDNSKSEFGKFFSNFKSTFLTMENNANLEKNLENFKSFLYNQFLFYGGIEEDDVNFLNALNINNDEEWATNKEIFLFRQKVLESNYREIFRNLFLSNEINQIVDSRKHTANNNPKQKAINYNYFEDKKENPNLSTLENNIPSEDTQQNYNDSFTTQKISKNIQQNEIIQNEKEKSSKNEKNINFNSNKKNEFEFGFIEEENKLSTNSNIPDDASKNKTKDNSNTKNVSTDKGKFNSEKKKTEKKVALLDGKSFK